MQDMQDELTILCQRQTQQLSEARMTKLSLIEEVATLKAENERLRSQINQMQPWADSLSDQIEKLKVCEEKYREVEALMRELKKFAVHTELCCLHTYGFQCSCGLSDVLKGRTP